ncbi:MAG: hypothetical protein GEV12_08765 [Micromonosporaceae bacterium]|nr:hypothetical protein [Micromonosporaceae bacterium]
MALTPAAEPTFCLFGTSAPANLGLAALRAATLGTLLSGHPGAGVTIFDDGLGARSGGVFVDGHVVPVTLCGARISRRVYRPEAYLNMRASALLGLPNPGLARIDACHAVLDLSGGDSFSDLYGVRTFRLVAWPKRLALLRDRPLVLLPQTYGPFRRPRLRRQAAGLVRRAAMAWSRDPDSFSALHDLLGADFDPDRHRDGVDVAFALSPRPPDQPDRDRLESWWQEEPGPVVGINVSGLTLGTGRARYGLSADGVHVVKQLCEQLLAESDVRVLLVPHVRGSAGADDDRRVTDQLHSELSAQHGSRVAVTPSGFDAHQAKWVISRTAWFVGMRMHATIAALSSGVPVAGIAYSMKVRGVFATVGQEKHVADARNLSDDELLDVLWRSWQSREQAAAELAVQAPVTVDRACRQLDDVVALAQAEAARRGPTRTG